MKLALLDNEAVQDELLQINGISELYDQTKWILKDFNEADSDQDSDEESDVDSDENGDEDSKEDSDEESDRIISSAIHGIRGVREVIDDIAMFTQSLQDLSAALQCPAIDSDGMDQQRRGFSVEGRAAHEYYADLIIAKYPQASEDIAECLGKANWARYQRLQLERDANAHNENKLKDLGHKSAVAESEFRDSGIGASIPTASSYSETIVSYTSSVSGGGSYVQLPRLPPEAKMGLEFECVACASSIKTVSTREWRSVPTFWPYIIIDIGQKTHYHGPPALHMCVHFMSICGEHVPHSARVGEASRN